MLLKHSFFIVTWKTNIERIQHEQEKKIREQIFKMLFRVEFYSEKEYEEQMNLFIEENEPIEKPDERYIEDKFNKIIAVLEEIDKIINESSKGWKNNPYGQS